MLLGDMRKKMGYVYMSLLICITGAIIFTSDTDNLGEVSLVYKKILEEKTLPDGTPIEAVAYAFADFNKDDVPELLLQKGYYDEGHPILGECNGLTIISIEDGKPTVVYEDQCTLIRVYQHKNGNLILLYGNSPANPVAMYSLYSQGKFEITSSIHAGAEGYIFTFYNAEGDTQIEVLGTNYADTFEIIKDDCKEIEFEEPWLKNKRVKLGQKERYLRSKSGELVTDYYSYSEEDNIVQYDRNAKVIFEKEFNFKDKNFTLFNIYRYEMEIYAADVHIQLRYIKFKNIYYLVGKYKLDGVCSKDMIWNEGRYRKIEIYGNPVCNVKAINKELWIDSEGLRRYDFCKEEFENDMVETYCWVTVEKYKEDILNRKDIEELSDDLIVALMRDIPGEAG